MKINKYRFWDYNNPFPYSLTLLIVLLSSVGCHSAVSVETLRAQLKDKDYRIRIKAAHGIGEIGRPAGSAYPDLLAAMRQETTANYQNLPFYVDAIVKIGQDPAAAILQAVKNKDHILAPCIVSGLKDIDPEAARKVVPELAALLRDQDNDIRSRAAESLQILGSLAVPAIEPLIEVLKSDCGICRHRAIMALGSMKRDANPAISELIVALNDRESYVRFQAVGALGDIGPEARAAIPALLEMLKIESAVSYTWVEKAVKSIGKFPPQPIAELVLKLKSPESQVRGEAFEGLRHYEKSRALENFSTLLNTLKTGSIEDRVAAVEALGFLGWANPGRSVPPLIEALKDKDERIQLASISALGSIGAEAASAVPALSRVLREGNANIKTFAGFALIQIGRPSVFSLVELLKDGNANVKVVAAYALGNINFPRAISAIPELRSALKDTDPSFRAQAAISLALIDAGAKDALPILIEALKSNNQQMRQQMPMALYNIGSEAVPALIELAKDENQVTSSFALMALGSIDTSEAIDAVKKLRK